jgi:hypothetical protein
MMKQMVAAARVGIINTPNQPTYRRLSVLVIQLQNFSHALALSRLCSTVVMVYKCGKGMERYKYRVEKNFFSLSK